MMPRRPLGEIGTEMVAARIPGAEARVVHDSGRDRYRIVTDLRLHASLDVSAETLHRHGEDAFGAAIHRVTGEIEYLASVSFAPMLAEREAALTRDRDEARARVVALEGRLNLIAFLATADEADRDRLAADWPALVRAIEEGAP